MPKVSAAANNLILRILTYLFYVLGINGLECYRCGVYDEPRLLLLGSDFSYDESLPENSAFEEQGIPKCNNFNASLPIFRVKCKEEEKGCLKGWLNQVKLFLYVYKNIGRIRYIGT